MLSTHGANVKQPCIKYNLNEDKITDFSSNINIFKPHINYELLAENISFSINRYLSPSFIKTPVCPINS